METRTRCRADVPKCLPRPRLKRGKGHRPYFHLCNHPGFPFKRLFAKPENRAGINPVIRFNDMFSRLDNNDVQGRKLNTGSIRRRKRTHCLGWRSQVFADNELAFGVGRFGQFACDPLRVMLRVGDYGDIPATGKTIENPADAGFAFAAVKAHSANFIPAFANPRAQGLNAGDIGDYDEALPAEFVRQCASNTEEQRIAGAKDGDPPGRRNPADFFQAL